MLLAAMDSLQALPTQRSEEEHEQHLLDLFKIRVPRNTLNPFRNSVLRNATRSNTPQATHWPEIPPQPHRQTQRDQAVASDSERGHVNGDTNKKDGPIKAATSPNSNDTEDEERNQNTPTEASQSPTNASRSTNTGYSTAPSLVPQKPLAEVGTNNLEPRTEDRQAAPHQEYELANTKGLFFELPTMNMRDNDIYQCSQIKDRLRDAIEHQYHPKKGVDRFYSLRYMMVKPKGRNPKATVVVTCCNKYNEKKLEKIARALAKFDKQQEGPMSKYPIIVHVDEPALQRADGEHILSSRIVYAFVSDNAATLSGVVAELESHSGESPPRGAPRKFTIGGIILVGGVPYALTVAHPFQPQHAEALPDDGDDEGDNELHSSDEIVDDDSSDEDGSGHQSLLAMYDSDDGEDQQSSPTTTTIGMPASEAFESHNLTEPCTRRDADRSKRIKLGTADIWSEPRSSANRSQPRSPADSDFALIRLNQTEQWKPNLINLPGDHFQEEVAAFTQSIDVNTSADVWINAGVSGIQKGRLTQGTIFLDYGHTCYETREILLQRPLGRQNL